MVARRKYSDPVRCETCGTTDPNAFASRRCAWCKVCKKARKLARKRAYYAKNSGRLCEKARDRHKAVGRKRKATVEQEREYRRRRRAENPERERARSRASYERRKAAAHAATYRWRKANPEKMRAMDRNRRAARAQVPGAISLEEWRDIVSEFNGACAYCLRTDRKLTQDHMVPLCRGGLHVRENVVPACGSCNSRKNRGSMFRMLNL